MTKADDLMYESIKNIKEHGHIIANISRLY